MPAVEFSRCGQKKATYSGYPGLLCGDGPVISLKLIFKNISSDRILSSYLLFARLHYIDIFPNFVFLVSLFLE